jgi:uncharacterized protein YsxB (DUF464 family)
MTEVTIFENPAGKIVGIQATGHSNESKKGDDIVCAALSTVFDFLDKASNGLPQRSIILERNSQKPSWSIQVDASEIESLRWQTFYRFLITARSVLEDLADKHPDNCSITTEEKT